MRCMSRILIDKARRRLERETGTIYTPLDGRLTFALAFPGVYSIGMSALGLQLVYGMINSIPGAACERVFLPEPEDAVEHRRSRTRLFSLESQTDIAQFDVFAFSISYEMDYAAVVQMLELAGLPILSVDRDESHPLVIAGGPCATFNPEPLADIIDVFAIGDAEELIPEMVEALKSFEGDSREELLGSLSQITGLYVPRFYTPDYSADGSLAGLRVASPAPSRVQRRIVRDLSSHNNLALVLTPEAEFANMLLVEAIRGCKRQCRFCVSGFVGLPPRPRSLDGRDTNQRVGLVGSAVFDHPDATEMCARLSMNGVVFSVSSTRIESLTSDLARMMYEAGQRTITIAPEAGTERLRRILNKSTTDDEIFGAAEIAAKAGFKRLKLYFMLGLPGEEPDDVDGIARLAREIVNRHSKLRVQVSASCFVPKPWTPFQWCGMAPVRELSGSLKRLKALLAIERRIEISSESPRSAYVQAWLARGDRRMSETIITAASNRFNYSQAASELGLDTDHYALRLRDQNEVFPWDHIDMHVRKNYLWDEFQRGQRGQLTAECNVGLCTRCGVCQKVFNYGY